MADSMRDGQVRPVTMADVNAAAAQIRPSTGPWFETARNVVEFANNDGTMTSWQSICAAGKFGNARLRS